MPRWELDGVMLATLLLIGLWQILPLSNRRKSKLVFWTLLLFSVYLFCLYGYTLALVLLEV